MIERKLKRFNANLKFLFLLAVGVTVICCCARVLSGVAHLFGL